ncbi:hypothetical protein V8F06_004032 [Rhypophila decipiens]
MFGRMLRHPLRWLNESAPELSSEPNGDHKHESAVAGDDTTDGTNDSQETPIVPDYQPTVLDAIVVKEMLNKAFNLPPELVDAIVDLGEYWPHTSTEIVYTGRSRAERKDARGGHPVEENKFLLRTPPLGFVRPPYLSPQDTERQAPPHPLHGEYEPSDFQDLIASPVATRIHPCRKIVFTILSHDQGWGNPGGEGLYTDSWTWFEVGLERCNKTETSDGKGTFSPVFDLASLATLNPPVTTDGEESSFDFPLLPREDCKIQSNRTVNHEAKEHCVVWSHTDDVRLPTPDTAENEDGEATESGSIVKNFGSSGSGSNGESFTDGDAGAEAFETAEVQALADVGRGIATGDGEFVRKLKVGDIVTVWAKARFPGWVNYVDRVKVDVYWAI